MSSVRAHPTFLWPMADNQRNRCLRQAGSIVALGTTSPLQSSF